MATEELAQAATLADKFAVYEGLPDSFGGKELLEKEISTKPTVLLDENWFYLPARPMPDQDKSTLQGLLGVGTFKPWRGVKFCGGFHADYAVSFESGGNIHLVLFCFGCREARLLRIPAIGQTAQAEPRFRLTVDLTDNSYKQLRELFKKYHKERPMLPDPKSKVKPPAPPTVPVRL